VRNCDVVTTSSTTRSFAYHRLVYTFFCLLFLGTFKYIQGLSLRNGQLKGTIPREIAKCSDLTLLDLLGNPSLNGRLPPEIGLFEKLQICLIRGSFDCPIPRLKSQCQPRKCVIFVIDAVVRNVCWSLEILEESCNKTARVDVAKQQQEALKWRDEGVEAVRAANREKCASFVVCGASHIITVLLCIHVDGHKANEAAGGTQIVYKDCSLSALFPPIDVSSPRVPMAEKREALLRRKQALEVARTDIDNWLAVLNSQMTSVERAAGRNTMQHYHDQLNAQQQP
jgi:hypothetical protein